MRLPGFERDVVERWVSGVESNVPLVGRRADIDLHKRQGGLLTGLLNGVGDLLGTKPKTTTTTQANPTTQTSQVVSSPPPATTIQAVSALISSLGINQLTFGQPPPVATTQAPVVSNPPQVVAPPVQVTTAPTLAPTSQTPQPKPVLSSTTQQTSTIPIAIPLVTTATLIPTSPGNDVLLTTTAISFISSTQIVSLVSTSLIISTITSNGVVYPTTFATSIHLSPSTTRLNEDLTTMNPVMGSSMSGMGGISKMTIIISILSIFCKTPPKTHFILPFTNIK